MHHSTLLDRQRDIEFVDQQIAHLKEMMRNKNYHHLPQGPSLNYTPVLDAFISRSQSKPDGESKSALVSTHVSKPVAHVIGVEQVVREPAQNVYWPWHSKSRPSDLPPYDNGRLPDMPSQHGSGKCCAPLHLGQLLISS